MGRSRPIDSGHERADLADHVRRRVLPRPRVPVVLDHLAVGHQRAERAGAHGSVAVHLAVAAQRAQRHLVRRHPPPGSARHVQLMRMLHEVRDQEGNDAVGTLYTAIGTALHVDGRREEAFADPCVRRECLRRRSRPGLRRPRRRRVARRVIREETDLALERTAATSGRRSSPSALTPRQRELLRAGDPEGAQGRRGGGPVERLATLAHSGVAELKRTLRGELVFD